MKNLMAFGFGLMIAGFFWSLLQDSWSYFADFSPPSTDIFFTLMIMVWYALPWIIFFIGFILVLVSAKGKNIMEASE